MSWLRGSGNWVNDNDPDPERQRDRGQLHLRSFRPQIRAVQSVDDHLQRRKKLPAAIRWQNVKDALIDVFPMGAAARSTCLPSSVSFTE